MSQAYPASRGRSIAAHTAASRPERGATQARRPGNPVAPAGICEPSTRTSLQSPPQPAQAQHLARRCSQLVRGAELLLTYSCIPTETSGRQTASMRRRRMPNRPGVAAAAGEGGRSLSITSTRTAGTRGTARPSSWASQAGIEEVEPRAGDQTLPLVCRPGLELHTGWPAGAGSGMAACAATAARPFSAARSPKAGGRSTRSGSGWTGWPPLAGWRPGMATEPSRGCPSPWRRFASCGWSGPVESDTPGRRQLAAADRVSAGRGLRRSRLTPLAGSHQFCPLAASRRGCEQCEDARRTAGQG